MADDSSPDRLLAPLESCKLTSNGVEADLIHHQNLTGSAIDNIFKKSEAVESRMFNSFHLPEHEIFITTISNELKSSILPRLRHQITSLSLLLDPADMVKHPVAQVKLVLNILPEIEQTMDQLLKVCGNFQLDVKFAPKERDWRTSRKQDIIRLRHSTMVLSLDNIIKTLHRLLRCSQDLIKFPFACRPNQLFDPSAKKRQEIMQITASSWQLIDLLNEGLNKPDYTLVQDNMQEQVNVVEDALIELSQMVNFKPSHSEEMPDEEDSLYQNHPPTEKKKELGRLIVPIIKLLRLFFNKLSKASKDPVTIVSSMNSSQLSSLLELSGSISSYVDNLISTLDSFFDEDDPTSDEQEDFFNEMNPQIEQLSGTFDDYILLHLLPHLESLSLDRFDDKIHQKTWFKTWNNQFHSTTQTFLDACVPMNKNVSSWIYCHSKDYDCGQEE